MNVSIKKLHGDAVIPTYANPGDSGFDFYSIEDVYLEPYETKIVKTGLSMEIPEGYELQIRPRSGLSLNTLVRIPNSPGTVDSGYRGEIGIICQNIDVNERRYIPKNSKIAQGVICPVVKATFVLKDDLSDSERGAKGYGSSGA